jgi:NAD(P)-dependent dehydrogenase (short-subunit alcohol dehydrogenase family)
MSELVIPDLVGKVVLITGGSTGTGAALAKAFAAQGATVDDVVGIYLFLALAAPSGYIIGQEIAVNGGQLMP